MADFTQLVAGLTSSSEAVVKRSALHCAERGRLQKVDSLGRDALGALLVARSEADLTQLTACCVK